MGFKVIIPDKTHQKIMHWVNKTDKEVSGFGKVSYNKETQEFTVLEAYLLKQEVGAAHTDIDAQSLARLMFQTKDIPGSLTWWWHSHVKMPVFWSGTDTATIKELAAHGHCVATVFNQNYENRSAVAYKIESEFGNSVHLEDEIQFEIATDIDASEVEAWDKEFTDNVRQTQFVPTLFKSEFHSNRGYNSQFDDYEKYPPAQRVVKTYEEQVLDEAISMRNLGYGLMGYGVECEAKCLGYSPKKYQKMIAKDDKQLLTNLYTKLEAMLETGELDNEYNNNRK